MEIIAILFSIGVASYLWQVLIAIITLQLGECKSKQDILKSLIPFVWVKPFLFSLYTNWKNLK